MFMFRCIRVLLMLSCLWCLIGIEVWVMIVGWLIRFFMLFSDLVRVNSVVCL